MLSFRTILQNVLPEDEDLGGLAAAAVRRDASMRVK
jgi:hypothetical protein